MKVSVKVPATTANLGPGFDCMGMALPIYNTVTIEETVLPGTGIEINVIAEDDTSDELSLEHIPMDENSIIYKAVELLYNSIGQTPSELKLQFIRKFRLRAVLEAAPPLLSADLLQQMNFLDDLQMKQLFYQLQQRLKDIRII